VLEPLDLGHVLGVTIEPQGRGRVRLAHYSKEGTLLTLEYCGSHQGQHIFHNHERDAPCFALRSKAANMFAYPTERAGPVPL
jgi:hypothetical protein